MVSSTVSIYLTLFFVYLLLYKVLPPRLGGLMLKEMNIVSWALDTPRLSQHSQGSHTPPCRACSVQGLPKSPSLIHATYLSQKTIIL
jgi:hypothetical protein